jgi:hypothetical protein
MRHRCHNNWNSSNCAIGVHDGCSSPSQHSRNLAAENAAVTNIQPWFNVCDIYAHITPDLTSANSTMSLYGAKIEALANFTLTSNAWKPLMLKSNTTASQSHLTKDQ